MKKTNISAGSKWIWSSYGADGLYENTDDIGIVEIMICSNNGVMYIPNEIKPYLKDEGQSASGEGMVSERFALKLVAVAQNSVNINNLEL